MRALTVALFFSITLNAFGQNISSIYLDGVDDFIELGNDPVFSPSQSNYPITYSFWLKPESSICYGVINAGGGNGNFWLGVEVPSSSPQSFILETSNGSASIIPNCELNEWQYVTIIFDIDLVSVYINSELEFTSTSMTLSSAGSFSTVLLGVLNTHQFKGNYDDLSIWNYALTQAEIQDLMYCSPTGSEEGLRGYWNFDQNQEGIAPDLTVYDNNAILNGALYSSDIPGQYYDCSTWICLNDVDEDNVCDELETPGCTDQLAENFDLGATDNDGSCMYNTDYIIQIYNDAYEDGYGQGYDAGIESVICPNPECQGPGCCDEGTYWHVDTQTCLLDITFCSWQPDSNADGNIGIGDLLDLLSVFGDTDYDEDGVFDSVDDCVDPTACNYQSNPTEPCYYIDVLGVCGGGCEADEDGDAICDDIDDCIGVVDECGVCNGPGATEVVIDNITILYDSVYAEAIDNWFVFEIGADTVFNYFCEPVFNSCGDDIGHEGYDYSTVLIGDQCWFSENCRYLPLVSYVGDDSETDPCYYVYNYEGTDVAAAQATESYATYGALYN